MNARLRAELRDDIDRAADDISGDFHVAVIRGGRAAILVAPTDPHFEPHVATLNETETGLLWDVPTRRDWSEAAASTEVYEPMEV